MEYVRQEPGEGAVQPRVYGPGLTHKAAERESPGGSSAIQGGIMSESRRTRGRSAVIAGGAMAALATAGVFAVPASAHNSVWSVTCNSVSVHLTNYNKHVTNSVTLQVVGGE